MRPNAIAHARAFRALRAAICSALPPHSDFDVRNVRTIKFLLTSRCPDSLLDSSFLPLLPQSVTEVAEEVSVRYLEREVPKQTHFPVAYFDDMEIFCDGPTSPLQILRLPGRSAV